MITSYDTLQSTVADWLNRADLETAIETFIQLAEEKFNTDPRCRRLEDHGAFSITADGMALPSGFDHLESWYHDGPTYFGPIEITNGDGLSRLKAERGESGVPQAAAIIEGTAYFAPEPDGTYATRMVYWQKITPLSDANTTNWLLDDHSGIYLYGALVESAPYLKDDNRVVVWQQELERRLEQLGRNTQRNQYSGTMRRHVRPIG